MPPHRTRPSERPDRAVRTLRVRLRRTSPTHHVFELERGDGSRESVSLETRSCLLHDLVHFAVESEAALADSFYGRLARGVPYASLAHPEQGDAGAGAGEAVDDVELMQTERVVGPLQGAWSSGRLDPAAFVATLRGYLASTGDPAPAWLTEDLLARVADRLRRLDGHWRATKFGDAMELVFALPAR